MTQKYFMSGTMTMRMTTCVDGTLHQRMTPMTMVWGAGQKITTKKGGTSEGRWKRVALFLLHTSFIY